VVLDVMMPGEDGLSVCRYLRATSNLPVILLTAAAEETDRIIGLEIGADDYVTKPFNPRELLARIKAVLRRTNSLPPQRRPAAQQGDPLRPLDARCRPPRADRRRRRGGAAEHRGSIRLLCVLVDHPGMVLTRDQLLDLTVGRAADVYDRSIDNQVSRLRKKIELDPRNPALIKTHWGGGYSFSAEVSPA
jgi:two-component system OmpR family response regulator